jgi:hypothetical protein
MKERREIHLVSAIITSAFIHVKRNRIGLGFAPAGVYGERVLLFFSATHWRGYTR